LASTFGVSGDDIDPLPSPDWNVAPTKPVPAVIADAPRTTLTTLRWGLVPSWAPTPDGPTLFNARAETILDKPAFREAVRQRRCLLPADGWYEWAHLPDGRVVPHFLTRRDRGVVAFAGVWEQWRGPDGTTVRSAAIVTGAASGALADVHNRVPLVLDPEDWPVWLDARTPGDIVIALLAPTSPDRIDAWPVSDRVGDVRAVGPHLALPVRIDEQPALF
jgi:putative SOS response-associated peptidase YedK